MTNEELITVARSHLSDMPELSCQPWATPENMPNASITDTVIVTFTGDKTPGRMLVVLEKQTGRFVFSGTHPQ